VARIALAVLVSGCATVGSLGIGPTLDGDGVVRLEGTAGDGPVPDGAPGASDPQRGALDVWSVGVRFGLAAAPHLAQSEGWLGLYVEYMRLGTASAPWGAHAMLTLGFGFQRRGRLFAALSAGPDRLAHGDIVCTNDGTVYEVATDGLDLSFRARLNFDRTSWWQVGAAYVRHGATLGP
jgi:hypothetical protein